MPRRKNRRNLRKGSQRKALSDVISCSTEYDVMTEERVDALRGLISSIMILSVIGQVLAGFARIRRLRSCFLFYPSNRRYWTR